MSAREPVIRALRYEDVKAIAAIDEANTKHAAERKDMDLWRLIGESTTSFGAEADGKLVGFILADVRPWEFGARDPVGWIIAVGVDPAFKGHKLGRRMAERVIEEFRRLGVEHMSTLVEPGSELVRYFDSLGFKPGPRLVLERRVRL
ncbi:MAG TPA: GNAT family N-acetyltransferase [Candidatus Thermoplasmatota archaeon]|nr:GNAT family N-acetyltransferase [Candidatus Thermoplasmatota archaeon]